MCIIVWAYEYNIKDHLGNVRVSFKSNSGVLQQVESTNYDPFGIELNGTGTANSVENRFKYQDKESLTLFGLSGINDFGARYYDKTVGRWWGVDALADISRRHSPYQYNYNNPLRFTDPDGMASQTIYDFNGKAHEVGDADKTTIYQAADEEGQTEPSNVAQTLFNNVYEDSKNKSLDCSKDYACYPATWKRLEKAYFDTDGFIPDVFKTTWNKPYKGSIRVYPKLNTIFSVLFGSDVQNKLWRQAPYEHRGKGGAGAMVYAGLGQYANVWAGELNAAAVVQFWDSQQTYESVRDGKVIPNGLGHSVIFVSYKKDSEGNIIGFQYVDQHGVFTTPNINNYVYFGANLIDLSK